MSLQREFRGLLMISCAMASVLVTQSCALTPPRTKASVFMPSPADPVAYTGYEVSDESCADAVLTVDLNIPDVYTHTYEFPIRARLYIDIRKVAPFTGSIEGISADDPFNGSGFNGGVNVFELTATSVTVSAGFFWTNWKHEKGEFNKDFKLPYGKPLSARLPDGSTIEMSWREPKSPPKQEPPEEDADPSLAVQNRS